MEMVAIRWWVENILEDMARVEAAQHRHVHRSFDNSSQTPDTRKKDCILDLQDQSNPPDGARSDRYRIDTVEVRAKAKA
jgi:hypothetical protein